MTRRMKEYNYETGRTRWLPQSSCLLLFYLYPTDQISLACCSCSLSSKLEPSHCVITFTTTTPLFITLWFIHQNHAFFFQMHEPSSHNLAIPSICHLRGHTKTGPPRDTRFLWEALKKKNIQSGQKMNEPRSFHRLPIIITGNFCSSAVGVEGHRT